MKQLTVGFIFIFIFSKSVIAQTPIFEGNVKYKYINKKSDGSLQFFPIDVESVYWSSSKNLRKVEKGKILQMIGNIDILLDIEKGKIFEINHDEKTVYQSIISEDAYIDIILKMENIDTLGLETILGYECIVVQFNMKKPSVWYGPEMNKYTYWFAKDMHINQHEKFAQLQGKSNETFLDGSFGLVPLKFSILKPDGSQLEVEAVEIKQNLTKEIFELPEYLTK